MEQDFKIRRFDSLGEALKECSKVSSEEILRLVEDMSEELDTRLITIKGSPVDESGISHTVKRDLTGLVKNPFRQGLYLLQVDTLFYPVGDHICFTYKTAHAVQIKKEHVFKLREYIANTLP